MHNVFRIILVSSCVIDFAMWECIAVDALSYFFKWSKLHDNKKNFPGLILWNHDIKESDDSRLPSQISTISEIATKVTLTGLFCRGATQ